MDQNNITPDDNQDASDAIEPMPDPEVLEPDANGSLARTNLPSGYSRRGLKKYFGKKKDNNNDADPPPRDKELAFMEHIRELRARILYSIACICVAMVATWNFGNTISAWFARPIEQSLKAHNVKYQLITIAPSEGLLIYFQIVAVAAIIISMPFIMWQFWRFLEPALSNNERRYTLVLVPFSTILFVAGCALGYYVSPLFFDFFLAFQPPGSVANLSYQSSIALLAKMLLVFGICFQVPIIVIFLHKIGLTSEDVLWRYWRHVVVGIVAVVAVLTPTWDPLTLTICSVPPIILYFVAIWMIKWL